MANKTMDKEALEKLMKNEFAFESKEEDTEDIEEVKTEIVEETEEVAKEEPVKDKSKYNNIVFPARGLHSLKEAIDFMETSYFKGLQECEKNEYRNWLIKK
jgi:hypothetical protein